MTNVSDLKISCYNRKGSKDIDKERKPLNLLFASVHANEVILITYSHMRHEKSRQHWF